MYKVMHWMPSLVSENNFMKTEHYFTDSKEAIDYFFRKSKTCKNIALVVSTDHTEFVFMYHYEGDFPKELRPETFVESFTEFDMYDFYEKSHGFTRRRFKFNLDGSTEEI